MAVGGTVIWTVDFTLREQIRNTLAHPEIPSIVHRRFRTNRTVFFVVLLDPRTAPDCFR